jgi:rRNA biogenesis protein RRP5
MAAQKRSLEDTSASRKVKKLKTDSGKNKSKPGPSTLLTEEVDFPRGGGTSFTPLEVKAIRAEAMKEANAELFKVCFSLLTEIYLFIGFTGSEL